MFWLCLRSPCADPSSETTTAAEGGGRIEFGGGGALDRGGRSQFRNDDTRHGRGSRGGGCRARRGDRPEGGGPARRSPPDSQWRPWRCPTEPPATSAIAAVPRCKKGFGRRIRGRQTGVWSSSNERSPRRRQCSLRRYRSAGVAATRPSSPPKWRPWWWCGGGCRHGLRRRGGRDGGGVGGRRGRRQLNDAMAVPRGRDSAPPPPTERRQPFRWCRRHPPRQRRKEIMCRPLSSSSYRRSPTADEGKALGLDRNDDLRTDNRRKASDATADDNNSSATSAARMS